ncbi:hypothetical protein BZA05DRAFT_374232 [Tricharina praecox]|uniref:uncharacterized protein n=1 Tax=Tricharina praecox TaxID=43433 RepID=UPI00221F2839|nr:uncharacterized protein BZA05DRAFT_374232 [Tricharina praecox]KAI5850603.1 hypothetical protein BZA05DRAFT_374232 [Tricharina praecox]
MFGSWSSYPVGDGSRSAVICQIFKYKGPLTFPEYSASAVSQESSSSSSSSSESTFAVPDGERNFYTYFAKIKRATDVTPQHLDVLNLSVSYDVPVEDLVGGKEWLPKDEDDEIWAERKRELLIENDTAYQVMARIRRDIKLGHMYKFFQALEMVTPYYGMPDESEAAASMMDIDSPSPPSNDNGKRPASEEAAGTAKKDRASPESDPSPEGKKEEKFSMPERFRDDLVKNFVEPICWGHGVRVYPPRAPPKLHVQHSKFSVHLNYHIHWTPTDSQEARSGLVDGPALGMQIRHEHAFRALNDPAAAIKKRRKKLMAAALAAKGILVVGDDGAAHDVVGVTREIAALLSIAQMRAKEGATEKKVRFRAIGKVEGSYWDDVFMVSSLHHHVSISHLRVSKPYLRFLRTGKMPNPHHAFIKEGGWEKLHLNKTKYYSLMVPEDRVEAARALVTVLKYVTRNEKKM